MTVESKIDLSRKIAESGRVPNVRRHGERTEAAECPQPSQDADDEPIFPPISPPLAWPRVFPGL